MGRVNFSRGKERVDKRETGVPLTLMYHQRLKDFGEVIKCLCSTLFWDKELKKVFTPVPIISFIGTRKLRVSQGKTISS